MPNNEADLLLVLVTAFLMGLVIPIIIYDYREKRRLPTGETIGKGIRKIKAAMRAIDSVPELRRDLDGVYSALERALRQWKWGNENPQYFFADRLPPTDQVVNPKIDELMDESVDKP